MIFSNVSKREKNLFFLTVFLIIIWVMYVFVIVPIRVRWKDLNEKIELAGLKLEKNQMMIDRKETIRSEHERYVLPVKMVSSEEEEMAKFLTEIESLVNSSSVYIIDVKPRPIKKIKFYKKYIVELNTEGDISQISKFIYDIQNSTQLLKIDAFSLGIKGAGTNSLKCHILVSKILIL